METWREKGSKICIMVLFVEDKPHNHNTQVIENPLKYEKFISQSCTFIIKQVLCIT